MFFLTHVFLWLLSVLLSLFEKNILFYNINVELLALPCIKLLSAYFHFFKIIHSKFLALIHFEKFEFLFPNKSWSLSKKKIFCRELIKHLNISMYKILLQNIVLYIPWCVRWNTGWERKCLHLHKFSIALI